MERLKFVNARDDTPNQSSFSIVNARVAWQALFRVSTGTNFKTELRLASATFAFQELRPPRVKPQRDS
jgi:hypothetical protein